MSDVKKDNSFHVRLDNLELSEASKARIEKGIQEVVLRELANYPNPDDDTKPKGTIPHPPGVAIIPPKYWRGFIAYKLKPEQLNGISELGKMAGSKILYE